MTVSFATLNAQNLELTPMRVSFQGPGQTVAADLGGTLGNVLVKMGYKKSDLKADQLGSTVIDRRVSGIDISVTTEIAEIQNKTLWKVVFPHATILNTSLPGGSITAASPAVVTSTAHGLNIGDVIQFTAGTVPTGITLNTPYYILPTGFDANDFEISLTQGGAAINGSGSAGSGVTVEALSGIGTAIDWKSAIGDSDQANAGILTLHPLSKADADVSTDYTFFKACSDAQSEITYSPEKQGALKIVWNILPDLSSLPSPRFFRYGATTIV